MINTVAFFYFIDTDIEKPQAKKRKTEDLTSTKNVQNGKKRKRDEETEAVSH